MYSCFSFISSTTVLFFLKKIIVLTIVFVICHPPFSCMAFYLPGGLHTNHKDFWKYCLLQFWLLFVVIFFSADKFLIPVTIFFPSGTLTVLWKSEVNWLTLPAFNMLVFFFLSCCAGVYRLLLFPPERHVTTGSNLHWFYLLISS